MAQFLQPPLLQVWGNIDEVPHECDHLPSVIWFQVDDGQSIGWNYRDRDRVDDHEQVLAASYIKVIMGLENAGWFWTGAS